MDFDASHPFIYHVWDRKLKTVVLSGSLKEFEGKKGKLIRWHDDHSNEMDKCFDANGKELPRDICQNTFGGH